LADVKRLPYCNNLRRCTRVMNRRIATVALLAWYAIVAVVGPGLHVVLGCEHHHHHGPAAPAYAGVAAGGLVVSGRNDGGNDDDDACPLCKLLSMARTTTVAVRPFWVANVLPNRVRFSCDAVVDAPRSLCQIRGPPRALATV
jgi:hypothetical protein